MAVERTLAIIKPDAVGRGISGDILSRIHAAQFKIVAIKSKRLTKTEAEGFYAVHRERPFFKDLTEFMSSGKIVVMVLEAENAITKWRDTMGATDPAKAAPGPSAKNWARASRTTAPTVLTRQKLPRSKSRTSSLDTSSSSRFAETSLEWTRAGCNAACSGLTIVIEVISSGSWDQPLLRGFAWCAVRCARR